jgi:hypothetical protein
VRKPNKRGENQILTARRETRPKLSNRKSIRFDRWKNPDWTGCLLSRKSISPKTQAAAKIKAKKKKHNRISDRRLNHKTTSTAQPGNRKRRDDFSLDLKRGITTNLQMSSPSLPHLIHVKKNKFLPHFYSKNYEMKLGSGNELQPSTDLYIGPNKRLNDYYAPRA